MNFKQKRFVPVDLYLNFEKSSWKNQVQQSEFSILIFVGYTGIPVRNRLKIQFVEADFSKLIFQKSSTYQGEVVK